MGSMGIDGNQQKEVFKILAGILHVGNLDFVAKGGA